MKIEYFDSVWDAIEPSAAEAANMKARSNLMIAIQESVDGSPVTWMEKVTDEQYGGRPSSDRD